jgi:hypothetical protein
MGAKLVPSCWYRSGTVRIGFPSIGLRQVTHVSANPVLKAPILKAPESDSLF